jgi:hypothetical protein
MIGLWHAMALAGSMESICDPFDVKFHVDQWPAIDAYNVLHEIRSNDGQTYQCTVTYFKPNGEVETLPGTFPIGPDFAGFGYHIPPLGCEQLQQRVAYAGIQIDWGGPCDAKAEYSFATAHPDFDCSKTVDTHDLIFLIDSWGPCADWMQCPANLTADSDINGLDMVVVINHWGVTPQ